MPKFKYPKGILTEPFPLNYNKAPEFENWALLFEALQKHYRIEVPWTDREFGMRLALHLMLDHLPSFAKARTGRKKSTLESHKPVVMALFAAREALLKTGRWPTERRGSQAQLLRKMAVILGVKGDNKIEVVKGRVRRATPVINAILKRLSERAGTESNDLDNSA